MFAYLFLFELTENNMQRVETWRIAARFNLLTVKFRQRRKAPADTPWAEDQNGP